MRKYHKARQGLRRTDATVLCRSLSRRLVSWCTPWEDLQLSRALPVINQGLKLVTLRLRPRQIVSNLSMCVRSLVAKWNNLTDAKTFKYCLQTVILYVASPYTGNLGSHPRQDDRHQVLFYTLRFELSFPPRGAPCCY